MKSLSLLFNTSGRLSRRQFWLAHLFILGATIAFSVIAGLIIGIVSSLPGLAPLADWGPTVIGGAVYLFGGEEVVSWYFSRLAGG